MFLWLLSYNSPATSLTCHPTTTTMWCPMTQVTQTRWGYPPSKASRHWLPSPLRCSLLQMLQQKSRASNTMNNESNMVTQNENDSSLKTQLRVMEDCDPWERIQNSSHKKTSTRSKKTQKGSSMRLRIKLISLPRRLKLIQVFSILFVLSVTEQGMLKSPTIIVGLSIFLFN